MPNFVLGEIELKRDHRKRSLGDLAEEALKKAVARVVEEHRITGEPLAVWRDGKVAHVPVDRHKGTKGRVYIQNNRLKERK